MCISFVCKYSPEMLLPLSRSHHHFHLAKNDALLFKPGKHSPPRPPRQRARPRGVGHRPFPSRAKLRPRHHPPRRFHSLPPIPHARKSETNAMARGAGTVGGPHEQPPDQSDAAARKAAGTGARHSSWTARVSLTVRPHVPLECSGPRTGRRRPAATHVRAVTRASAHAYPSTPTIFPLDERERRNKKKSEKYLPHRLFFRSLA
jgi:hypothetical protein